MNFQKWLLIKKIKSIHLVDIKTIQGFTLYVLIENNWFQLSWSVEELHAQESKVLIETIELKYKNFQVLNSKDKVITPKKTKRIKKPR